MPVPNTSPLTSAPVPPTAEPPPRSDTLAADFTQLQNTVNGRVGIALKQLGGDRDPVVLGNWESGPAWSTMKVPLVIAALRAEDPPAVTEAMKAAITRSDNAAADEIWHSLGDPQTAATKVGEVLHASGDPTTVQSQKVRPPFSAFGQTDWSLVNQVRFLASAACDDNDRPVFDLMSEISADQQWGLGTIYGTRFKGGWGPSEAGAYLVRQVGVIGNHSDGFAVAIAVQPASGSFDDGTAELTEVATWLEKHTDAVPSGHC